MKQQLDNDSKVNWLNFILYPIYLWVGLLTLTIFLIPDSEFTRLLLSPLVYLDSESSENWEGCWEGNLQGKIQCFETDYAELTFVELKNLEGDSNIYLIEGEDYSQITKKIPCSKQKESYDELRTIRINHDTSGFFFTWQEQNVGYLDRHGKGEIHLEMSNDSIFSRSELIVKIDIDSEILIFNSTIRVTQFDELQFEILREGILEKIPCPNTK